jgi:hypothetical protein
VPRPTSTPRRQRPGSEAPELTYKGPTGAVAHELLYRHDEQRLEIVEAGRPREFRWPPVPSLFPKRIAFASRTCSTRSLAVHTSFVEPWRHQITAVWEAMLPRQPLRFLLPDDPGAGKTSMAGLFIKELTRGDFDRCLVVSPGSLAARLRGPLPSRRSPSRSIGPDAPVGEGNPLKFDQTPLYPRSSLIPFRTSSRTPTRASPKRLRILCAPNFQIVDDLDAILAKLAGRRHRPRARGL